MAGFTGVKVEFPEMHELQQKLRQFPSNLAAKHLGAALRKASKPGLTALRSEVRANQKGPTGNLRRAIATKVKTYKKTGNAVALVGFTKAGTGKTAPTAGSVQKGKSIEYQAYGGTYEQAREAADAIRSVLDGYGGSALGCTVSQASLEAESDDFVTLAGGDLPPAYQITMTFDTWWQES
jgi:hypothetical protein